MKKTDAVVETQHFVKDTAYFLDFLIDLKYKKQNQLVLRVGVFVFICVFMPISGHVCRESLAAIKPFP